MIATARQAARRPHGREPGARSAFTLAELVIVMAVMGIVAGISVPRFAGAMARRKLELNAGIIVSMIEVARSHASATSSTIAIYAVPATGYMTFAALHPTTKAPVDISVLLTKYGAAGQRNPLLVPTGEGSPQQLALIDIHRALARGGSMRLYTTYATLELPKGMSVSSKLGSVAITTINGFGIASGHLELIASLGTDQRLITINPTTGTTAGAP